MKIKETNYQKGLWSIIILLGSVLLLTGFTKSKESKSIEYLNVHVNYHSKFQIINISNKSGSIEKRAIVSPYKKRLEKRYEKAGYQVTVKEVSSLFDNTTLLEVLEEYGKKGWELESHSLGVSGDYNDGVIIHSDPSVSVGQYILSRESQ